MTKFAIIDALKVIFHRAHFKLSLVHVCSTVDYYISFMDFDRDCACDNNTHRFMIYPFILLVHNRYSYLHIHHYFVTINVEEKETNAIIRLIHYYYWHNFILRFLVIKNQ